MQNIHRGSYFDDFLEEEGLFEECKNEAEKRVKKFKQAYQDLSNKSPNKELSKKKKKQ